MAQKYRLVARKNMGKDNGIFETKYYAQSVSSGRVELDELCTQIADGCTLTSADVKAVLDRFNKVLDQNLQAGKIVQMGEFGTFRLSVTSTGATREGKFTTSNIKGANIIFAPGAKLQATRKTVKFEKIGSSASASAIDELSEYNEIDMEVNGDE
jgi:predicted histone-like DNA-binding protein